jgi:hypothetical protein
VSNTQVLFKITSIVFHSHLIHLFVTATLYQVVHYFLETQNTITSCIAQTTAAASLQSSYTLVVLSITEMARKLN